MILRGLDLSASIGYTRAIILENSKNQAPLGKNFYQIPLWRTDLVGVYRIDEKISGMLDARYCERQFNSLTNTDSHRDIFGGTGSFLLSDTKLTGKPTRHTELELGVDDLTDGRYYVYYPYPGRSRYLEAKISI